MKKKLLLLLLLSFNLSYLTVANAQSTVISSTGVVDSDSFTWSNGKITATFLPAPNFPSFDSYVWSGGTLQQTYSSTLNFSGAFSFSVPSNYDIQPGGSGWTLTICPNASAGCFNIQIVAFGATQDLTSTINSVLPGPRFGVNATTHGYGPVELNISVTTGTQFYNTTINQCQQYNGSAWTLCNSGSFTLTTTGSSGASTYIGGVLNIPVYSGGGSNIVGTSDVLNQSTSQGSTTLVASASGTGVYRISYYTDQNVTCTTGSNVVFFSFQWTDVTHSRTISSLSLTLTSAQSANLGSIQGVIPIYVENATSITYTSTVSGSCTSGTSSYDVHVVVESL